MPIKRFSQFLSEALIDVDRKDLDMIYAPIKKLYKDLQTIWKDKSISASEKQKRFQETMSRHKRGDLFSVVKTFNSSQLKSETAKQANKINPIRIEVYNVLPPNISNSYNMQTKVIMVGLPHSVWEAMTHRLESVPQMQLAMLANETSDVRLLSTIRHELTHWLDDSLHNQHLLKKFTKFNNDVKAIRQADRDMVTTRNAIDASYKKHITKGENDIYLTAIEITPYVNQIAELKRRIGSKKYDKLTWAEIMTYMPSLEGTNRRHGAKFRRIIFSRMAREGLITKNLRKKVDI
jgi:hypothetical protein